MRVRVFVGSGLVVLAVGGWYVLDTLHTPTQSMLSSEKKKEAMQKLLDRAPVLEEKDSVTMKTYHGKYVQVVYPEDAIVYAPPTLPASLLESFQYGIRDPRVDITIQVITDTTLDEYAGVVLRRQQSALYHEAVGMIGEVKGVVFVKETTDGAEKSGFFQTKGNLYSITVSGYNSKAVADRYKSVIAMLGI